MLCLDPLNLAAPPGLVGRTTVAMLTCQSPRKVMRAAYHLASQALPQYSSKFSRKDFTLPQLFACLAAKEKGKGVIHQSKREGKRGHPPNRREKGKGVIHQIEEPCCLAR